MSRGHAEHLAPAVGIDADGHNGAIDGIFRTIRGIGEIADGVSESIRQLGVAVDQIARGIADEARRTTEVSATVTTMAGLIARGGKASSEVLCAATMLSDRSAALRSHIQAFLDAAKAP